jgi:hypothetical protein
VTSVTEIILLWRQIVSIRNQEGIMSLLYQTSEKADLKRPDYGFILTLVCLALALVVASVVFTPAPVGTGITSEITSVGP